jgi:hypothetical protein
LLVTAPGVSPLLFVQADPTTVCRPGNRIRLELRSRARVLPRELSSLRQTILLVSWTSFQRLLACEVSLPIH